MCNTSCVRKPSLSFSLVRSTWVRCKKLVVEARELRTVESSKLRAQILAQEALDLAKSLDERESGIYQAGLGGLEEEAGEIVALEKAGVIVRSARQVASIEADERVGRTCEAHQLSMHTCTPRCMTTYRCCRRSG